MIERLLELFSKPQPVVTELPEADARLALGALLVRVAKVDDNYAAVEIGQIDKLLAAANSISPIDAAKMRADCERLERAIHEDHDFVELLRQGVPFEMRRTTVQAMWEVVLADNIERPEEQALVQSWAAALGLSDEEIEIAHQAATKGDA